MVFDLSPKVSWKGNRTPILACLLSSIHLNATLYSEAVLTYKVTCTINTCACTTRGQTNGGTKMYGLRAGPIGWLAAVPTHSIVPHYPQPSLWTWSSQSITLGAVHCSARHAPSGYNLATSSAVNTVIALWTIAADVNGQ